MLDNLSRFKYIRFMAYAYINPYKSSYLAAIQELQLRENEIAFATQRIAQLKETIRTLEPLANEEGIAPTAGIAELCRQVLMSQPGSGFTAGEVMQFLAQMGVDISGYANPLAVLHTTLTRLVRPGSGFMKGIRPDGQLIYAYDQSYDISAGARRVLSGT
jgi:hypothetical protein